MSAGEGPLEVTVGGFPASSLEIYVPGTGPWFCDADMINDPGLSSAVVINIGGFKATGTVDPSHDGVFALNRRTRVVAGRGQWGKAVAAISYLNDAGVRASDVAAALAKEVGETLGSFTGGTSILGSHYVRDSGTASRILEHVAGGSPWWLDFAGVTHVGPRPTPPVLGDAGRLLEFDPRLNMATLAVDDLSRIGIGTVIADDRLDAPIMVTSYEIRVTPGNIRVHAWCGSGVQTQLADVLRAIITRATDQKLFGKYRYRVQTLNVDRVNVQAVNAAAGVPDVLSVPMAPGVAGVHAKLALGAIVYVEFIAGERSDPEITGFAGRGGAGFLPQNILIGATDDTAPLAARQGDMTTTLLPPMVITGTVTIGGTPSPFTGVAISELQQALGTVSGGSTNGVKIG